MSNVFKVIDMIANESLAIAHEDATFLTTVNRQYDADFKAEKRPGGKIGGTLRIREPNQYTRRQGSRVMDIQDQDESTQTLTVATQDGVDMSFTSADLALNTDDPKQVDAFSERFIKPAMGTLISGIESDMIAQFTKDIYNVAGTAGTVVGASGDISALTNARAKLNQGLAPAGDRSYQIDSVTMGSIVNGKTGLFHPDQQVKKAFVEGYYSRAMGADFYENERTWSLTNGADVAGEIDESTETNFVQGTTTLHLDGMGAATVIPAGAVFTIESVYAVHPETKASYSHLQQFVVTTQATADGGGDVDVIFSPPIRTTGAKKNVTSANAFTSTGWNNLDITFFGSASNTTPYRQNLVYHKDAFVFVTADMPMMDDAYKCVVKRMDNLSVRVWMGSDIRSDELLIRLDILYGGKTVRPAWACRVSN